MKPANSQVVLTAQYILAHIAPMLRGVHTWQQTCGSILDRSHSMRRLFKLLYHEAKPVEAHGVSSEREAAWVPHLQLTSRWQTGPSQSLLHVPGYSTSPVSHMLRSLRPKSSLEARVLDVLQLKGVLILYFRVFFPCYEGPEPLITRKDTVKPHDALNSVM